MELTALNSELKHRAEESSRAVSDLSDLMNATRIATLFLGRDLHITLYTPPAEPF